MILIVDNYDSFSYNLYQLFGSVEPDIRVLRNDEVTVSDIREMRPEALVFSPGPGRPKDAGICIQAIRELKGEVPMFGVCLGHQCMVEALGGEVSYAKTLMHGKKKKMRVLGESPLFEGLPSVFEAARYHSLVGRQIPEELEILAVSDDEEQEVMAVGHKEYPIYGVQFHPESVMTPQGGEIVRNFMNLCRKQEQF